METFNEGPKRIPICQSEFCRPYISPDSYLILPIFTKNAEVSQESLAVD